MSDVQDAVKCAACGVDSTVISSRRAGAFMRRRRRCFRCDARWSTLEIRVPERRPSHTALRASLLRPLLRRLMELD